MVQAGRTFRIFVSSTFSDLKEERNALQKYVFPRLRELCMQHGCRFQAIDLRWGVSEEAGLDQQTMRICLEEIARCQKTSPKPNFIILLGDRYGWQPVPSEIPADEFENILKLVSDNDHKFLVGYGKPPENNSGQQHIPGINDNIGDEVHPKNNKGWYTKDENAVPHVYCLQPRTGDHVEYTNWEKVENRLRAILRNAVGAMDIDEKARFKYYASATEQEIFHGALDLPKEVPNARDHVFGFFKSIENLDDVKLEARLQPDRSSLPESEKDKPLPRNLIDTTENHEFDASSHQKLVDLKGRLSELLGDNIKSYSSHWDGKSLTQDHIGTLPEDVLERMEHDKPIGDQKTLCVAVWNCLSRVIKEQIDNIKEKDSLEHEINAHKEFGEECSRIFIGREKILDKISDSFFFAHPIVVYGESGSGKSALMAKAVERARLKYKNAVIIGRFIGATPNSSDGRSFLEGLCKEILQAYGADKSNIPSDYESLIKQFSEKLTFAKAEKPLIIFLDALDQLSNMNDAENLDWLPSELPDNVSIVVSTLSNQGLSMLHNRIPLNYLLEIKEMEEFEGEQLLKYWLKSVNRTLQPAQQEEVLNKFKLSGLPLYLKLAFEEARQWKSYTTVPVLKSDISGMINDMISRLSSKTNHGETIVSSSLSYLAAAKNGLTEDELIDVLSNDEDVYKYFLEHTYHAPTEKNLPVVLWSRLYFDLESYLIEKSADGTSLLSFYHQQFREVVQFKYISLDRKIGIHQKLAKYFSNQAYYSKGMDISVNRRKLSELPFQMIFGEMWIDLEQLFFDMEFIEAKCKSNTAFDLEADFYLALKYWPTDIYTAERNLIALLTKAYSQEVLHIEKFRNTMNFMRLQDFIFQQLRNRIYRNSEGEFDISLRYNNKYRVISHKSPARSSKFLHICHTQDNKNFTKHIGSICFSPNGRHIFAASIEKNVPCIDPETGKSVFSCQCIGRAIGLDISPNGLQVVAGGDLGPDANSGFLQIFSALNGVPICSYSVDKVIIKIVFITESKVLAVDVTGEMNVYTFDTNGFKLLKSWRPFGANMCMAIAVNKDRTLLAAGEYHDQESASLIHVWDVKTLELIREIKGPYYGITSLAFSEDSRILVSGSIHLPYGVVVWDWLVIDKDTIFPSYDEIEHNMEILKRSGIISILRTTDSVSGIAVYPGNSWVVATEGSPSKKSDTINVFNILGKKGDIAKICGHSNVPIGVAIDCKAQWVATLHGHGEVFIWPAKELKSLKPCRVPQTLFEHSTDSHCTYILSRRKDGYGELYITDTTTGDTQSLTRKNILSTHSACLAPSSDYVEYTYWEQQPIDFSSFDYPDDPDASDRWFKSFQSETNVCCFIEAFSNGQLMQEGFSWTLNPQLIPVMTEISSDGEWGALLFVNPAMEKILLRFSARKKWAVIDKFPSSIEAIHICFSPDNRKLMITVKEENIFFYLISPDAQSLKPNLMLFTGINPKDLNFPFEFLGQDRFIGVINNDEIVVYEQNGNNQKTHEILDFRHGVNLDRIATYRHNHHIADVCVSGDGKTIAISDFYPSITILDSTTFKKYYWCPLDQTCRKIFFGDGGRCLLSIGEQMDIYGLNYLLMEIPSVNMTYEQFTEVNNNCNIMLNRKVEINYTKGDDGKKPKDSITKSHKTKSSKLWWKFW